MTKKSKPRELAEELAAVVGEAHVAGDEATRYIYSRDMTENAPHPPDLVVMPASTEEVRGVVKIAARREVPLTPFVSGANVGGLAIPVKGGIVADLKRMKKIEVNEEEMYALVEPGVTFGHMRARLDGDHPSLRYSYPLSPPHTSVMCNALLDGLNNLSMKHGAMSDWVNGLEAVLPTGEVVRTGSAAVTGHWWGRVPLPDLAGLFLGWQGTTGIVTKAAVQLWPNHPYRKRYIVMFYDIAPNYELMIRLARTECFDDVGGMSWPTGKMLFGARGPMKRLESEPLLFIHVDFSAVTEAELKAKDAVLRSEVLAARKRGVKIEPPIEV